MKNYISNNQPSHALPVRTIIISLVAITASILVSSTVGAQGERQANARGDSDYRVKSEITFRPSDEASYRPYLIKIIDSDSTIIVPATYENPEDILDNTGIVVYAEDRYTFQHNKDYTNEPLVGFILTINRATLVKVQLRGSDMEFRTQSTTVAQLLEEQSIVLNESDIIRPSLDSGIIPNMQISISRVGTETVVVGEDLNFTRKFIDDPDMTYGTEKIETTGINGRAKVTYRVTYHDNVEVSRVKLQSITLKSPTDEVVIRGTKGAPSSSGPLNATQIQFLGNCESGMTATRNSGNGYYGAFQFSAGTWNAMNTGYARADLAPLDVQIQAVQKLLSRSSIFGQFPGCANRMVSAGLL